jgi:phenylpropionate dioxygenase-like ring-hydroxylating dioxygenase large terminal subunit
MNPPGTSPPVPRVWRGWYVLAESASLRAGAPPVRASLYGRPIVLFRGADGEVGALEDRCPHRDVPLSRGHVRGSHLACAYHGWEFDRAGACQRVPCLVGEADRPARRAAAFPVQEQQGFVWVWGDPKSAPPQPPPRFPWADDPSHLTVRYRLEVDASLHAVAENALDVPHTGFLHGGLFRKDGARNRIRAELSRYADRAVCDYIGEPRPEGLVARILSPSGGVVTHADRFILPGTIEVEYSIGTENHLVSAAALTPAADWRTVVWAVVSVRTRLPALLVKPIVQPIGMRIFAQDAEILRLQTASVHAHGQQRYVSTEVDLLGPQILKLLTRAAEGEAPPPAGPGAQPEYRTTIEMDV